MAYKLKRPTPPSGGANEQVAQLRRDVQVLIEDIERILDGQERRIKVLESALKEVKKK